jgi:hypothetical protein
MDRDLGFRHVVLFCDLFWHSLAPEIIGGGAARPDIPAPMYAERVGF